MSIDAVWGVESVIRKINALWEGLVGKLLALVQRKNEKIRELQMTIGNLEILLRDGGFLEGALRGEKRVREEDNVDERVKRVRMGGEN